MPPRGNKGADPGQTVSSLAEEMQTIKDGNEYYAISLMPGADAGFSFSVQSSWCGYADNDPTREIRKARLVYPRKMADLWRDIGQAFVVVNSTMHYHIFLEYLGGNALVETAIARKHTPDWVGPSEVRRLGSAGFHQVESLPESALRKAPTPKHRMRILVRDGRRCRVCGRSPDKHVDLELHVHHIRPAELGGLTHDENLITLCGTCHRGLDPHHDHSLFTYIERSAPKSQSERSAEYMNAVAEFRRRTRAYRERAKDESTSK